MARQSAGEQDRPGGPRNSAYIKGLMSVLVWGASFVAIKIALGELPPPVIIWVRAGAGVAVLTAVVTARREVRLLPGRELWKLGVLGFLGIAFHQWLQATALETTHAGTAAWIVATTPVFIALLGRALLGERLGLRRTGGIALAALGVLTVVSRGDVSAVTRGRFGTTGDLLSLASALNWAVFSVLSRRLLRTHSAPLAMFYVMIAGWLLTSLLVVAEPASLTGLAGLSSAGWLSVAFLGILCSGVAYVFWYDALAVIPAARVGTLLYLEPLVALCTAALLLGEPVTAAALAGGALILVGIWTVNRPGR